MFAAPQNSRPSVYAFTWRVLEATPDFRVSLAARQRRGCHPTPVPGSECAHGASVLTKRSAPPCSPIRSRIWTIPNNKPKQRVINGLGSHSATSTRRARSGSLKEKRIEFQALNIYCFIHQWSVSTPKQIFKHHFPKTPLPLCAPTYCLFVAISVMEGTEKRGAETPTMTQRGHTFSRMCLSQGSLENPTVPRNPSSIKDQSFMRILLLLGSILPKKSSVKTSTFTERVNR